MYVELHAVLFLRAAAFLQQYKEILSAGNLVVVKNPYFHFLHLYYKTELTGTANIYTSMHPIFKNSNHTGEDAIKISTCFNCYKSIFFKD